MPVLETAKRKQELQAQEGRRDQLVEALRDEDWIERLTHNADYKRYLARVEEAQKLNREHLADIVKYLSGPVKTRDERAEWTEKLLLVNAAIFATAEVTGWPAAQEKRLSDARKELPDLEKRIGELKEGI